MTTLESILICISVTQLVLILCLIGAHYDLTNLSRSYCQSRDESADYAWHCRDALTVLIQHLRRGGSIAIIGCFGTDTHDLIKKHEQELSIPYHE